MNRAIARFERALFRALHPNEAAMSKTYTELRAILTKIVVTEEERARAMANPTVIAAHAAARRAGVSDAELAQGSALIVKN